MLSGLLIILNIIVCIALIGVVLLQRSEGGAFGSGGSPTGLVTARGAGDLLTRTTWVLFATFLALSLGLTLLGAHDRSTSSLIEKLKGQQLNPAAVAAQKPEPAPATGQGAPTPSTPFSPFGAAPAPQAAPAPFSAPVAVAPAVAPTSKPAAAKAASHAAKPAARKAPEAAAVPVLVAPPPQAAPAPAPPPAAAKDSAPATGQP